MRNPLSPRFASPDAALSGERPARGVRVLIENEVRRLSGSADCPATVLVPSEQVLLLAVPLPPMSSRARRQAALPFAVEDRIAEPLSAVHIALGEELSPGIFLAGVVSHEVMRGWLDRIAAAGVAHARLVPDALSLPVPPEGGWSLRITPHRALVRCDDGTGFALPASMLPNAWRAAGSPICHGRVSDLPPGLAACAIEAPVAVRGFGIDRVALDLRQGDYAALRQAGNPLLRRMAIVTALGVAAHGVIAVADTAALDRIAEGHEMAVRAMAGATRPPVELGDDLSLSVATLQPDPVGGAPERFLSLLTRVAATVAGDGARTWRTVTFDGATGTLSVEVEGEPGDLDATRRLLADAGLAVLPPGSGAPGTVAVRAR